MKLFGKTAALKEENRQLREKLADHSVALHRIAFYSIRRGVRQPNGSTKVIERIAEAALAGRSLNEAEAKLSTRS